MKLIKLEDALTLFAGNDVCGLKNSAARRKLNECSCLTQTDINLLIMALQVSIYQAQLQQNNEMIIKLSEVYNKIYEMEC